ncbi:hypothetical protein THIOKS13330039 [Thiocapsa sp. KS1]|nr:hypothetical protein THIOKS13330039 [Thiocapsa sp. KS1]
MRPPRRWSGATRNWEPDALVLLNPGKPTSKKEVDYLHNDT